MHLPIDARLTPPGRLLADLAARPLSSERFGRYRLLDRLGSGGMGVVYRALDERRGRVVAVKTLPALTSSSLSRFKNEFRSLARLSHPNIVSLDELIAEGDRWAFSMELVDGLTFIEHVRRIARHQGGFAPVAGLFRQLAEGLAFLHESGTIHRDIKPRNVMVTPDERVVLLDFGLAAALGSDGQYQSRAGVGIGTVSYMAPEQATGRAVSPASDWYAFGVMLFEAICGRLPFEGTPDAILEARRTTPSPDVVPVWADVPTGVLALCSALLSAHPANRPDSAGVLETLRSDQHTSRITRPSVRGRFVGRRRELDQLADDLRLTRNGHPAITFVRGESGVGKSALVDQFMTRAPLDTVLLAGRCYHQASVPYKALDTVIDALARYLSHLPAADVTAVLPRDIHALTRLFPVLLEVVAIEAAPRLKTSDADARSARRRAAVALRELLGRIGDRHPLVLIIDDLQWGDLDSAALLADVLLAPDAPALLAIGCCRAEDWESSQFLARIRELRPDDDARLRVRVEDLAPLDESDMHELVSALTDGLAPATGLTHDAIVRESGGRPFLAHELAQALAQSHHVDDAASPSSLDDVVWRRVGELPAVARELLRALAVAGTPLTPSELAHTLGRDEDERTALNLLTNQRFIRRSGPDGDRLEPYHDRVREAVLAHIDEAARREYHGRLVSALMASPQCDLERLAVHLAGAGHPEAPAYCVEAAVRAAEALAFDHAAVLLRRALSLGDWSPGDRREYQRQLGDALANAGRGLEAAEAYRAASHGLDDSPAAIELQHRAALQLLTSGHVDEGLTQLDPVLRSIGLTLASSPRSALASLSVNRLRLRFRGTAFQARDVANVDPAVLRRVDVGWSVVLGLSVIDPIRGADLQTRNLLMALEAGEPFRICRALSVEAGHLASSGAVEKACRTLEAAEAIAASIDRPYATAMASLARGSVAYFRGHWGEALAAARRAADLFRHQCSGVAWEIDTANAFTMWSLAKLGRVRDLAALAPDVLQDALERGDRYAATNVSTQILTLVNLGMDLPDVARARLDRIMSEWSQNGYHVQHHDALLAFVPIELYTGHVDAAWQRVEAEWADFRISLLSQVQDIRVEMLQLRAYTALALLNAGDTPVRAGAIRRDVRRLRREGLPWTTALADYIDAALAWQLGDREAAIAGLRSAVAGFDAVGAALFSACSCWRLSALVGHAAGADIRHATQAWFDGQRIRRPDLMAAVYAPGLPD